MFHYFTRGDTVVCALGRGMLVNYDGQIQSMVDMPLNTSSTIYFYNSIICTDDRSRIKCFLINPTNKEYHKVPQSTLHYRFLMYGIGLGFDARYSDFKIMRYGSQADMK